MQMAERWIEFCKRVKAKGDLSEHLNTIVRQYSVPERYYHTIDHVLAGFEDFDEIRQFCKKPEHVEFAWWNHDAVYDTKAKDNEEKSAEFASNLAIRMGLDYSFRSPYLIVATKHQKIPTSIGAKIIVDLDLAIFGKPEEVFDEYEQNIRREYSWVPEKEFREGRSRILQTFLNREWIYQTDSFREKYEVKARMNLERSIASLTKQVFISFI